MKKLRKKLMALTMAGALACTPVTAFAAATDTAVTPNANGEVTGDLDKNNLTNTITGGDSGIVGTVDTDVVKVVLPTVDVDTNSDSTLDALSTLQFTMDPQLLISQAIANGSTVPNFAQEVAEDATVLFENKDAEGTTTGYSDTSDPITIINKGTVPVSVKVEPKATVTDNTDGADTDTLEIANDEASFKSDGTPEICFSLNTGEASPTAIKSSSPANYTFELSEAPEGAYKTTYDTDSGKFVYNFDAAFDQSLFDKKELTISGKANPDSSINWNNVASDKAAISLAWTITKGTTFSGTKPVFASTTAGTITVQDGTTDYVITSINSAVAKIGSKTYDLTTYDLDLNTLKTSGTATFNAAALNSATLKTSADVTITYTVKHGTKTTLSKQFTSTITVPLK